MKGYWRSLAMMAAASALLAGCGQGGSQDGDRAAVDIPGGDAERGRQAILQYGCASCHAIPDINDSGGVGPDLDGFDERAYIAGQIPNRPEELIRWLRNPQDIAPGTVMPNLDVTEQDARDIAAFLYGQ